MCLVCSKCGCDHDGRSVEDKLARKRGQHGPAKKNSGGKRPQRQVNTYRDGALGESPNIPLKKRNTKIQNETRRLLRAIGESSTQLVPGSSPSLALRNPPDILRALGHGATVDTFYAHIPSQENRRQPQTWSKRDDPAIKCIFLIYKKIVFRIASTFCGMSREATDVFWSEFLSEQHLYNEQPVTSDILKILASYPNKSKRGNIGKRVIRAILCKLTPLSKIDAKRQSVPGFTMSRTSFSKGKSDFAFLADGICLESVPRSIQRFATINVESAIAFILSPEYVAYFSWGTKKLWVDGKTHIFPAIMRKKAKKHIYDGYVEKSSSQVENIQLLLRPTFYRIMATLTVGGAKTRKAVDYVTCFLVNDSFAVISQIIVTTNLNDELRQLLLKEMESVRAYLKYGFDAQMKNFPADCLLHQLHYGLTSTNSDVSSNLSPCAACERAFRFFDDLIEALGHSGSHVSTIEVVKNCASKAKPYLGHRLRVVNQQLAIAQISSDLRQKCMAEGGPTETLIIIDFKMKLEPMYYREKTVEHYGKRGISWHGAMAQYFTLETDENSPDTPPMPVDRRLYFGHLSDGDNRQDREAAISMIEAILMRLRKDLPDINTIILQSDNATCYQNAMIALVLPYISAAHNINILRFIYTETQDGKSAIDAHFARSMRVLKIWVEEGNNCVTPTQAVMGLKSHGGLPNRVVELVEHDRDRLQQLSQELQHMEATYKRFIPRANEIMIEFTESQLLGQNNRSISDIRRYRCCPDFRITVFDYSGIGQGRTILVKPSKGMCINESDVIEPLDTNENDDEGFGFEEIAGSFGDDEDMRVLSGDGVVGVGDCGDVTDEDVNADAEQDVYVEAETIDPHASTGPITGVQIATQGQLRRRIRQWRKPPELEDNSSDQQQSKDIVSYAVRRALQMHQQGELRLIDPRASMSSSLQNHSCATRLRYSAG